MYLQQQVYWSWSGSLNQWIISDSLLCRWISKSFVIKSNFNFCIYLNVSVPPPPPTLHEVYELYMQWCVYGTWADSLNQWIISDELEIRSSHFSAGLFDFIYLFIYLFKCIAYLYPWICVNCVSSIACAKSDFHSLNRWIISVFSCCCCSVNHLSQWVWWISMNHI